MRAPFLSRLRNRSLRARLQLMMLSLLALSIGSLFVLHLFSERALLARVREYTEELSTAIEITQEQPGAARTCRRRSRPTRTSCASWV